MARIAAYEDALYHLQRAVQNDAMGAEEFVRTCRQLARKQFLDKALLAKAAEDARSHATSGY